MSESIDSETITMLKDVMEDDFQELINTFLDDSRARIPLLREELASGDTEALRHTAHSLKGSSGNLGATALSQLCFQVEQQAKQKRTEGLENLIERIEAEFQQVVSILEAI